MISNEILTAIDQQIATLEQARALLAGEGVKRGPGRPKASKVAPNRAKKRGTLSAAGREAIRRAQKARWAAIKAAKK